jgi:hypothetical protein
MDLTYRFLSAIENGQLEVVQLLIANGADIHASDDLALRVAAQYGHIEVVQLLIANGADIHARNDEALRVAAVNGHIEIMQLLIANGANVHAQNDEALRWAAEQGHLEVVQLLLNKGANVHADNDEALKNATRNGHLEVVDLLQKAILEQDFIRVIEAMDVQHATQRYVYERFSDYINKLIEYNHPKLSDSAFVEYLIAMYSRYSITQQEEQQMQNSFKRIIDNFRFVANEASLSILRRWYRLFPNERNLFIDLKNRLEHEYEQYLVQHYKPGVGKGFFEQLQNDIEAGYVVNEKMTLHELIDLFIVPDLINRGISKYMDREGKIYLNDFIKFTQ